MKTFTSLIALLFLLLGAPGARALLTGGPHIIAAPASTVDAQSAGGAVNLHQQGFNERQGVLLLAPLAVDGGTLPAGMVVNSHMIFLNIPDLFQGPVIDTGEHWTFDGPVVGVMSDTLGALEAASNAILGSPTTIYPGAFAERGIEPGDGYTAVGNNLGVSMTVNQPGDWIRVVTVPVVTGARETTWGALKRLYRR